MFWIALLALFGGAFILYSRGWLKFRFVGITRPVISLAIFGVIIEICNPSKPCGEQEE